MVLIPFLLASATWSLLNQSSGQPLSVQIEPDGASAKTIELTSNVSPKGEALTADTTSLLLNGRRWMPAMGEFHYSRYDEHQWRQELLKMKAGGISIVGCYVFWIHHEEVEGTWDWSGNKNLRKFMQLCQEVGLKVLLRGGPWAHGECRNGGLPDWMVKKYKTRSTDPSYLAQVKRLYTEIAKQTKGLFWAQGGPIIGFQLENEFYGPGSYFDNLRQLAVEAGIVVPMYTRTGWPALSSPTKKTIFPMYGGYPIGFWDRGTEETAGKYANTFVMSKVRNPDRILQGDLKLQDGSGSADREAYPYLCCEIGGGMAMSYHRRVIVKPDDIGSIALVKLASGNNLEGYYMYHGGTNPDGKLTTLNETQATNYWNDVPVKTYDFQAPLGEYGQVRDHYHILRRMHLMMDDWGAKLAAMPTYMPDVLPKNTEDAETLRWSARSDGKSGFVFVNNYQRMKNMPKKSGVQFELNLPSGKLAIPRVPIAVPANSYFTLPFNLEMEGVALQYATAQPICRIENGNDVAYFFAEIPEIKAEFSFSSAPAHWETATAITKFGSALAFIDIRPGFTPAFSFSTPSGKRVSVRVLSHQQSLHVWKERLAGRDRLVYFSGSAAFDGNSILTDEVGQLRIYPAPKAMTVAGGKVSLPVLDGFGTIEFSQKAVSAGAVTLTTVKEAGKPRTIRMGSQGVAEQPIDAEFEAAATWKLGVGSSKSARIVTVNYVGDVARLYFNGKLVLDNFYNGSAMEFDPDAFGAKGEKKEFELKVLPLQQGAPIYLDPSAKPDFGGALTVCAVKSISVRHTGTVTGRVQ
jgi:beta-galactosidase